VTADAGGAVAPLRRRRAGGTGRRWRGARGDAARPEPAPTPHERMPSRHWPGARRPLNEGMRSTAAPSYRHHPPGTSRPRAKKTRIGDFSKRDRVFAVNPSSQTPEVTRGCDLRGAENRGRSTCYASYVDEPVMMVSGVGTKHYFHQNHLYSVAAMTDSVGAVVERYRYDAYGRRTVTNAAGVSRLASSYGMQTGFTGRYHDAETGLIYFRNRMYDPRHGRFLTRDIAGYSDGMSLYSAYYVPNRLDPMGNKCEGEKYDMDQAFGDFTYASGEHAVAAANEQNALSRAGQAQAAKQQLQQQFQACLASPGANCSSLASSLGSATRTALSTRLDWEGARQRAQQLAQNMQSAETDYAAKKLAYEKCMSDKGFYCTYGSSAISICCDTVTVVGYFLPGPGTVTSVTATAISVSNGIIYAAWCGPDVSTASTALDEAADLMPPKYVSVRYKILCNAVDIAINVNSIANQ